LFQMTRIVLPHTSEDDVANGREPRQSAFDGRQEAAVGNDIGDARIVPLRAELPRSIDRTCGRDDRASPKSAKKADHELRAVGHQDRYAVTFSNSHRLQTCRQSLHVVLKLTVGDSPAEID